MSAYLVDSEHIAQIIYWAKQPGRTIGRYNIHTKEELDFSAYHMAANLAQANIDSLIARYGEKDAEFLLGDYTANEFKLECSHKATNQKPSMLSAADIWNMCQCLSYQSCEVDNWIETDAYWLIHNIQSQAAREMASNAKIKWSYAA